MDLGWKGLRAVVTGGTRGIGLKIAETLASEGVDVAICSRNADEVKAVAARLPNRELPPWVDGSMSRTVVPSRPG